MDFSMNRVPEAEEESSWTSYVEASSTSSSSSSSFDFDSSAVSDSVLCAAWRPRKKARRDLEDDALEDTACSYANSIPKEKVDWGRRIEETSTEERVALNECSELRKRGLCLVPLSVLLAYLG